MSEMIRSICKYTFKRKLFTALIFVIVIFSAVFSAFTLRLGTAFAYDSTTEDGYFTYVFSGSTDGDIVTDRFNGYFADYGFVKKTIIPTDRTYALSYGDKDIESSAFYTLCDETTYGQLSEPERYFSLKDVIDGAKYIVLSSSFAEELGVTESGETLFVNGVGYEVKAIGDLMGDGGWNTGDFVVISCEELALAGENVSCSVYLEKEISNSKLKKIAEKSGTSVNIPEKGKFVTVFLILSVAICALFAVNVGVLFNAFISANDKYYAVFKILGITTGKLTAAMAFPCAAIAVAGAALGVGVDFAIALFSTILEKSVYLTAWGIVAVMLINIVSAFIGAAVACYRHAVAVPAENLRRSE